MSYPNYSYSLPSNITEGEIGGFAIRWQPSAYTRLDQEAARTKQPKELLKALTEHFLYLAAKRLKNKSVRVTYVIYILVIFLGLI